MTVARSAMMRARAAAASNSAMPSSVPPLASMPSALQTQPAVWNIGMTASSRLCSSNPARSPIRFALLTTPRWLSITPFGTPVVPLVYWICTTSLGRTAACRTANAAADTSSARPTTSAKVSVASAAPITTVWRRSGKGAAACNARRLCRMSWPRYAATVNSACTRP